MWRSRPAAAWHCRAAARARSRLRRSPARGLSLRAGPVVRSRPGSRPAMRSGSWCRRTRSSRSARAPRQDRRSCVGVSCCELYLGWRPEPGNDPGFSQPLLDSVRLTLDFALPLSTYVIEQAPYDLAAPALCPTANDAAVDPYRRPGVAVAIEQPRAVFAQVPAALHP